MQPKGHRRNQRIRTRRAHRIRENTILPSQGSFSTTGLVVHPYPSLRGAKGHDILDLAFSDERISLTMISLLASCFPAGPRLTKGASSQHFGIHECALLR